MGVLQTLFHQPSRTYASTSPADDSKHGQQAAEPIKAVVVNDKDSDERAARRSQYYSAAHDLRLRKEWDLILANDKMRATGGRTRRPASAGAAIPSSGSLKSRSTPNSDKSDEEKESDHFFTPHSSPPSSPQTRTAALDLATNPMQSLSLAPNSSPDSPQSLHRIPTSGSSIVDASYASSVVSSSRTSSASFTNYSWSARGPASDHTHITIASSSRSSRHSKQRSEPSSSTAPASQIVPTPDWAKDIRWLVPAEESTARYPKRAHTVASPSTASLSSFGSRPSSRASARSGSSSGRSKTEPSRPKAKRRMSEIQEEVEDDAAASSHDEEANRQVSPFGVVLPRRKSNASTYRPPNKKRGSSTPSGDSSTSSLPTAELPVLLPHAEPGTYTSIVFPRTIYQPSKHPERLTNTVDIVHSGVASTTMSTICVTKHAAETLDRARRFSLPGRILPSRNSGDSIPKHLTPDETSLVALSSHIPSPTKVQGSQVLVQVRCVALEALDVFMVREKGKTPDGYGFIPGRGFCGKVIEAGLNISDFKKGDWVMGLLDVSKSGALAEFVVVDKRRIHRCPHPSATLTAEHLAVLAVSGVAAHRAVCTLPGPLNKARILVLQAHDGAGALVAQELVAAGSRVVVQVENESMLEKLKGLKLEGVKLGTPLEVLKALESTAIEGEVFDAVVDTVGGKEIWEACKKVFGSEGQFTTLVGDSLEACLSRNAHMKSNMRSLRSAFKKSDKRSLQYEWVSPSAEVGIEGSDIRNSLAAVCDLALEGHVRPRIEEHMKVPFERAPDILNGTRIESAASYLLNVGVAVVRLQ